MAEPITRRTLLAAAALRLPRKIRVGIAGMEGHTGEILKPIEGLADVELAAASDTDPKKLARLAPEVHRYADHRRMLDQEKLDVVGIGGSNGDRAGVILDCAARKIHIAAEKPLAIERADLERIKAAVKRNGVK